MVNRVVLSLEKPGKKRCFRRDVPGILSGCPGPVGVFKKFVYKIALMHRPMRITIMSEHEHHKEIISNRLCDALEILK